MSSTSAAAIASGSPSASSPLHEPRSTGEVISDAVHALRAHFGILFSIAVPFCAVDLVVREVANSMLFGLTAGLTTGNFGVDALVAAAPRGFASLGFFIASFWVQQLLTGAVTVVGEDSFMGRVPSVRTSLLRVLERGAPLILTGTVFLVMSTIGVTVVGALPLAAAAAVSLATGIDPLIPIVAGLLVGVVLAVAAIIFVTLRFSLYAPLVVLEERSLFSALRRSQALTDGRGLPFLQTPRFRLSVMLLIALALSSVMQGLFVVPRLVVAVVTGWSPVDGALPGLAQLPLWFAVPFGLIEVLTNAVVMPLAALLVAFFVFDLRVRYEPDSVA